MTLQEVKLNPQNYTCSLSDQFTAILSGENFVNGKPVGNTYENVIASVLRDGLIPDAIFQDNPQSVAEYYDAYLITPEMRAMGQEWLKHFKVEVVNKDADLTILNDDLLWMTISIDPATYNLPGIIPPNVYKPTHSVLGYEQEIDGVLFQDSYPPYNKKISPLNIFTKWQISVQEFNSLNQTKMFKLIKTASSEDTFYLDENNKRVLIGDANTLLSYAGKLWGGFADVYIISESEMANYPKGGVIIKTNSN